MFFKQKTPYFPKRVYPRRKPLFTVTVRRFQFFDHFVREMHFFRFDVHQQFAETVACIQYFEKRVWSFV